MKPEKKWNSYPMNILIVEDDAIQRRLYENQIKSIGFQWMSCKDATTALEVCRRTFYPLIILDLRLPDMDGLELCRHIRNLPQGEKSTILVISGRNTSKDIRAAMEAGADVYLIKPVSPEDFAERVVALMQRWEQFPDDTRGNDL
jgi:DNA-binding response OmpR family regulator